MSNFRRGASSDGLADGLYEDVITDALAQQLSTLAGGANVGTERLEAEDAVEALSAVVGQATRIALDTFGGEKALAKQVKLATRLLEVLREHAPGAFREGETRLTDSLLLHVARKNNLGLLPDAPARPATSLTRSELFTNSERHGVVQELLSELASADRVDLLCAFIKWSGFLKFRDALQAHCRSGKPLRVLTTTYLGATDARAIFELQRLGADVRISYEETPTRLHAKAWLFHRNSGLTTAYIGSSNLSRAALTDGLEWNVRVAAAEVPRVVEKFEAVFRRYWDDDAAGFRAFDGSDEHRSELEAALSRARRAKIGAPDSVAFRLLDVVPHDFQRRMLEDLEVARAHGHSRNLVVAATGTGKTVVAALDYARLRAGPNSSIDKLLFVAHRDTILQQARETFRAVLKDGGFGELLVGGARPERGDHVFASVQSLETLLASGQLDPNAFDMMIVDEVHHAPAPTYAALLRHMKPRILLGLTATPERMDDAPGGRLQLEEFFDRPWASELRLWEAIDRQILVPFNYFAVDDGMDVRSAWKRGRYAVSELSNIYSAEHIWVDRVAKAVASNVRSASEMRALAFCVDVAHARLAARLLQQKLGVRCEALTAEIAGDERERVLREFGGNSPERPRVLCVVDLLNEGVDVPSVDTLLLLRPTESATLFIQQLGRGLRRAHGKDSLTVLDFVGLQHDAFKFETRYTALLGATRGELNRALKERTFPRLPAGCSLQLEERPRKQILAALKRSLGLNLAGLAQRLDPAQDASLSLAAWLEREDLELQDVYVDKKTWSEVRERAGLETFPVSGELELNALTHLQRLVHVDDPWRLGVLDAFLKGSPLPDDERTRRLVRMLSSILFGFELGSDHAESVRAVRQMPRLLSELGALRDVLERVSRVVPRPAFNRIPGEVPLHLHGHYLTEEIAAAFDLRGKNGLLYRPQQGVVPAGSYDLLLVSLDKSSKRGLPHLQYRDYALSPRLFHWESQASTRRDEERGRRHLSNTIQPLLFIREVNKDARGLGVAYRYVGAVKRVDDEGERPIRITWELLDADLPGDLLERSRVAVA